MKNFLITIILAVLLQINAGVLTIVSITDTHAQLAKLRKITTVIRNTPHQLLIDAGDTLQGSIYATTPSAIPMLISNDLNTHIWVPGNHDFEILPFQFKNFKGITLGANWSTKEFTPKPWMLYKYQNLKVAFIGMTEHNLKQRTNFELNLKSPAKVLPKIIAEVRKAKPNLIVLICHDGLFFRGGNLYKLLYQYPEIKLVIGGHTHQEEAGKKVGNAWFVQAGKHAEALAKISIEFDDISGEVNRISSHLIHPKEYTIPAKFSPETEKHIQEATALFRQNITYLKHSIYSNKERIYNSSYADIIGNSMCYATKASCAIYASGRFNLYVPKGPINHYDLFKIYPFEDHLYTVELTPKELKSILDHELKLLKKGRRGILTKGIKFNNKTFTIPEPNNNGKITVAFTNYYLAGGGGLTSFMHQYRHRAKPCNITMREAILAFIAL